MDLQELAEEMLSTDTPEGLPINESVGEAIAQAETPEDRAQTAAELRSCLQIAWVQGYRFPFSSAAWGSAANKFERALRVLTLPPRPVSPVPEKFTFADGSRKRNLDRWVIRPTAPQDGDDDDL